MATTRVYMRVRGRVQNVGFRAFAVRHAQQLGVAGWVRNLPGGRQVELEIQGDEQAVTTLVGLLRYGPAGAHVEDVHVEARPVIINEVPEFRVR